MRRRARRRSKGRSPDCVPTGRGAALAQGADHLMLGATHRMRSRVARAMPAQDVAELGRTPSPGRSRRLRGCTHEGVYWDEKSSRSGQARAASRSGSMRWR
jgi:hypothetical protein